jgi:2-hydroxy-3-oxopropionate reductase
MMAVGVVGLGKMGSAIARNLLARGYRVSVWNRSRGAVDALVASGATPHPSVEELVQTVEAAIVSLWGDEAARDVTLSRVIPTARAHELIIEMSTLSPTMYEELESATTARSVNFLAAPVLGSVSAAQQGELTILAGGRETTFQQARPLLDSLGTTVIYAGSASASGVLKLANNSVIGVVAETLAELLQLCERGGIDRRVAVESLTGAFGRIASSKTQQLLDRDSEPRFSMNALLKDLMLAREAAESLQVPLPILSCVLPAVQRGVANGLGDRDYIALTLQPAQPTPGTGRS